MTRISFARHFLWLLCLSLAGCLSTSPPRDNKALNRANTELRQAVENDSRLAQVPAAVSAALLPPLQVALPKAGTKQLEQRFDLVVTEAPANQVFLSIVSGTRYSILVSPEINGTISLNIKDVTVFEALDTIRDVYGYEYTVDGTRIRILSPGLQTKIYRVNYITGQRSGQSDIRVTGGTGGGTGTGSVSASSSTTTSKADVWKEVEDSIRTLLACKISTQTEVQTTTVNVTKGNIAPTIVAGEGKRERGVAGCAEGKSVVINQMSGTIIVKAMPEDLRAIESMLHTLQISIERQVIIEAKIIDVTLNSDSQQGINWAGFQAGRTRNLQPGANPGSIKTADLSNNGGAVATSIGGLVGGGLAGALGSFGLGLALQVQNFQAMISFLETQGEVHVLSSPRISTINNQTAILKIGTDQQFVSGFTGGTNTTAGGVTTTTTATPIYTTYFDGISLDVTPQIDEEDGVTLHVHPMISSVTTVPTVTTSGTLDFATNKISETDSVVKARDGQVVVIGGLMTERYQDDRNRLPGGGHDINGTVGATKRELVILLKPSIVRGDNVWTDDLSSMQQRVESFGKGAKPAVR